LQEIVTKYRIKLAADLILNPLNIKDTVTPESNEAGDLVCLDNNYSYDMDAFDTALDKMGPNGHSKDNKDDMTDIDTAFENMGFNDDIAFDTAFENMGFKDHLSVADDGTQNPLHDYTLNLNTDTSPDDKASLENKDPPAVIDKDKTNTEHKDSPPITHGDGGDNGKKRDNHPVNTDSMTGACTATADMTNKPLDSQPITHDNGGDNDKKRDLENEDPNLNDQFDPVKNDPITEDSRVSAEMTNKSLSENGIPATTGSKKNSRMGADRGLVFSRKGKVKRNAPDKESESLMMPEGTKRMRTASVKSAKKKLNRKHVDQEASDMIYQHVMKWYVSGNFMIILL
jgi:hypothetical protein